MPCADTGDVTSMAEGPDPEQSIPRTPTEVELRALVAAITDFVLVLDRDGRYVTIAPINPALLIRPAEDLAGRTMHEVLPRAQADLLLGYIRQVLATQVPASFEYLLPIEDVDHWFAASVVPTTPDHVVWVARDITHQRWAEQRQAFLEHATAVMTS